MDTTFRTVPELLAYHARNRPTAPALRAPGTSAITYSELYDRARTLGARLASQVSPGGRVLVPMANTPESVVTVLGVMGAATAVPLNPAASAAQIGHLRAVVEPALVVTPAGLDESVTTAGLEGLPTMADQATRTRSVPAPAFDGDRPALLLETSGSSAAPRLVVLTHAQWLDGAHRIVEHLSLTTADRILNVMPLFHNHGLNGAVLASLYAGGEVVLSGALDLSRLADQLNDARPTWATASPTVHAAVLDAVRDAPSLLLDLPLRLIRSTSSPLTPQLRHRLQRASGVPVVEAYALTETSGQIAATPWPAPTRETDSVGRAEPGFELAALEPDGRVRPPGTPGEIAVRGGIVCSGYFGNPQATAELLVDGWLRTGDIGTVDGDGWIRILGREGDRINRGGEKVWLPDVDAACLAHPAVHRAMAYGVTHPRLGEDVAAAVVLAPGAELNAEEFRRFLGSRLPAHLVPRTIQTVSDLPFSAAGKPQRWRLRDRFAPDPADTTGHGRSDPEGRESRPRRSPLQSALTALWCDVLGVDTVAPDDDFVTLGGDSILATKLLADISATFGVDLSPAAIYGEGATVSGMAALIAAAATPRPDDPARTIGRRPDPGPAPLSFGQQRLWALHELLPDSAAYHVPLAFHLRGPVDEAALQAAFNRLVARHDTLRTRIHVDDGVPSQVITQGTDIWLRVIDAEAGFESAMELAVQDGRRPFDLERGPLTRGLLVRIAPAESLLVVTMHHLVTDGWSNQILVRELTVLYESARQGRSDQLAPLPLEYADYAAWQRHRMSDATLAAEQDWWRTRLRELPPPLLFGTAPAPAIPDMVGRAIPFVVPPPIEASLRKLARQEATTLFVVLLAACQGMLATKFGREDVVVGTPLSGRTRPEVADLVGFFINTVVMRADCSGDPPFRVLVRRAREWALAAYDHQEIPFEQVLKTALPDRAVAANQLTQVFVQLEGRDTVPTFEAVDAVRLDNMEGGARGDIEIDFHDAGTLGLTGQLTHAVRTVPADRADALVDGLLTFLERAGGRPGLTLTQIGEDTVITP